MNGRISSQQALIAYFLIALGFTWSVHFSINLLGYAFVMDLSSPGMLFYLVGLLGPLVAGIVVSTFLSGGAGVRTLRAQGARWRFPLRWYLVAILAIPLINLLNVVTYYDRVPPNMGWLVVVPVLIFG